MWINQCTGNIIQLCKSPEERVPLWMALRKHTHTRNHPRKKLQTENCIKQMQMQIQNILTVCPWICLWKWHIHLFGWFICRRCWCFWRCFIIRIWHDSWIMFCNCIAIVTTLTFLRSSIIIRTLISAWFYFLFSHTHCDII